MKRLSLIKKTDQGRNVWVVHWEETEKPGSSLAPGHRSAAAGVAEQIMRMSHEKELMAHPETCRRYLRYRKKQNTRRYDLPRLLWDGETEDLTIRGMQVIRIVPREGAKDTVVFLHGGSYVDQPLLPPVLFCVRLAEALDAEVYLPIYPLAPEHTCLETMEVLPGVWEEIRGRAGRLHALAGDSAGGGLALALCLELSRLGMEQPRSLVLLSPWADVSMTNPEDAAKEALDPALSVYGLRTTGAIWAGELPTDDPRVSPMYGDLSCLRNVTVLGGTHELLWPDIQKLCGRIREAGVGVRLLVGEGLNHVYPFYPIPEAKTAFRQICDALKKD